MLGAAGLHTMAVPIVAIGTAIMLYVRDRGTEKMASMCYNGVFVFAECRPFSC